MSNFEWKNAALVAIIACFLAAMTASARAAPLGSQVDNIATVSFTNGGQPISLTTAPASFIVEATRTPSTIEFFRVSPNAPDGLAVQINGSEFSPSGGATPDDFQPVGPPVTAGGATLDFSGPVSLTPAGAYFTGELVIVGVTDVGQNGDPTTVESIVATVVTDSGDAVTLRLFESGPDTGAFFAYLPSGAAATPQNDAALTLASDDLLTAT
ncbi:MAG: hypothetical protein AAGJ87_12215, partial [Pseudomonadota bacterium]